jgi:transcriptional regulator
VTDAPQRFVESQLRGIVGFTLEIEIETLTGKYKMSQNRRAEDQAGVVVGLAGEDDPNARDTGEIVKASASRKTQAE